MTVTVPVRPGASPTPPRAKLTSLHNETLRLGRLVDGLAVLAAALTLHRAPADLGKIASGADEAHAPRFTEAGLRLTCPPDRCPSARTSGSRRSPPTW